MEWNDHPAIYHEDVGLGGELSLFVPNWTNEIKLPNSLNETTLSNIVNHYEESVTP
jgi:DNA polymerase-1